MSFERAEATAPPLVCELVLGRPLDDEAFRPFLDAVADLTGQALVASGAVDGCDEVFDRRLWEGAWWTAASAERRPLARGAWDGVALRGFGVHLRPRPAAPGMPGYSTWLSLDSNWGDGAFNWVTCHWPHRFVEGVEGDWAERLTEAFTRFGAAAGAVLGCLGRMPVSGFFRYAAVRIDYRRQVYAPAPRLLLSAAHVERVGRGAFEDSGLFRRVDDVGNGLLYVERSTDLLDAGPDPDLAEFLKPLLRPRA